MLRGHLHVVLLLFMSVLVGITFPLIKVAEQTIPPLTLTMLRTIAATAVMLFTVVVIRKDSLAPLRTYWRTFAFLGLLITLSFISSAVAEEHITASLGSLLGGMVPGATFLIATLILRWEKFSWLRFSGTVIALAGMAMFIGADSISAIDSESLSIAIISGGCIAYSVNLLYTNRLTLDPFIIGAGTFVFASFFTIAIAFSFEQPLAIRPSAESSLAAALVGFICTGLLYLVLYYLIVQAGAVFAASSKYISPIVTLLLSHVMLGEGMGVSRLAGMAITLIGASLVNYKPQETGAAEDRLDGKH